MKDQARTQLLQDLRQLNDLHEKRGIDGFLNLDFFSQPYWQERAGEAKAEIRADHTLLNTIGSEDVLSLHDNIATELKKALEWLNEEDKGREGFIFSICEWLLQESFNDGTEPEKDKNEIFQLIKIFVWKKFEPKSHSKQMIQDYLKAWEKNKGLSFQRKKTVDELKSTYPELGDIYDSSGGVIGNWESKWEIFRDARTENQEKK